MGRRVHDAAIMDHKPHITVGRFGRSRLFIACLALLACPLTGCVTPPPGTPEEQTAAKEQKVKAAVSTAAYVFIRSQKDTATAADTISAIADAIPDDGTLSASDVVELATHYLPPGNPDAVFLAQQLASVFDQYAVKIGTPGTVAAVKAALAEAVKPFASASK